MTSVFQGDPKLSVTGDGLSLTFTSGEPLRDKGLVNAVIQTLFYDPWFVNAAIDDELYYIGSDFLASLKRPITAANLSAARSAGLKALQWLLDEGAANEIDVRIRNPRGTTIEVLVLIKPPAKSRIALLATKYGLNWKYQIDEG